MMAWTKLETCTLLLAIFLFAKASAGGNLGYGDSCSPIKGIGSLVGAADESGTCNSDKHLICALTNCKCNPLYTYDKGWLGVELLFGGCKLRPGSPCANADTGCVSNAECKDVCVCKDGYRTDLTEGVCGSGAQITATMALIPVALVLSYVLKF